MEINNKKNRLLRYKFYFIMFSLAICLTVNAFFCSAHNRFEILDKTTVTETWATSETTVINGESEDISNVQASFLNTNNSYKETITKDIKSIFMIAALPEGISLLLIFVIVFLIFFLIILTLLPDGWTLINQKVRLDN